MLESETIFRVLLNASCSLSALTTAACLGARPYPKISYRRKTRSSLTQAANFHMAKVLWRPIRYSMQLEYPLIVRPSSTRFQAIRSIGLAAVRTGTNDLCPAVPCDGVKARRTYFIPRYRSPVRWRPAQMSMICCQIRRSLVRMELPPLQRF